MLNAEAITTETCAALEQHFTRLQQMLAGTQGTPLAGLSAEARAHIAAEIDLLCQAANGAIISPSPAQRDAIEGAAQRLLAALGSSPLGHIERHIDPAFWQTALGQLIARVLTWLPNDLLNAAEAARILYPDDMRAAAVGRKRAHARVRRLGEMGLLPLYPNVREGVTGEWLFRRRDVERVRHEGLHEAARAREK